MNKGPAYPDTCKIKMLSSDNAARAQAFEAGEIDILLQFTFPDVLRVASQPQYHVIGLSGLGTGQYHPMNTQLWPFHGCQRPPGDDLGARPGARCPSAANGGIAPLNISNLLVPGTVGRNPEASKLYGWNTATANKILDDGGYAERDGDGFRVADDGRRLSVIFPNTPNPISELFKLDVEANLDIEVQIPNIEFASAADGYVEGIFHLGWLGVGGPDGDALYDRYHTSFPGLPGRAWSRYMYDGNPGVATPGAKIDELLDGARGSFDGAERERLWQEAELMLDERRGRHPLGPGSAGLADEPAVDRRALLHRQPICSVLRRPVQQGRRLNELT